MLIHHASHITIYTFFHNNLRFWNLNDHIASQLHVDIFIFQMNEYRLYFLYMNSSTHTIVSHAYISRKLYIFHKLIPNLFAPWWVPKHFFQTSWISWILTMSWRSKIWPPALDRRWDLSTNYLTFYFMTKFILRSAYLQSATAIYDFLRQRRNVEARWYPGGTQK